MIEKPSSNCRQSGGNNLKTVDSFNSAGLGQLIINQMEILIQFKIWYLQIKMSLEAYNFCLLFLQSLNADLPHPLSDMSPAPGCLNRKAEILPKIGLIFIFSEPC